MSSQTSIYDSIVEKLEIIKNNILKIKDYTEIKETLDKEYLEELLKFSTELNMILARSEDLKDQYIEHIDTSVLTNNNADLALQKNLRINKKIQEVFLPYMLYMQILLQNN
jgi:hypothetical protein